MITCMFMCVSMCLFCVQGPEGKPGKMGEMGKPGLKVSESSPQI